MIPRSGIEFMLKRTQHAILVSAWAGKPEHHKYFQGAINAYKGLLGMSALGILEWLAKDDASNGGYQPSSLMQAAWACLPENLERMSFSEVQEFLQTQGVQISTDSGPDSQINAVNKIEHSEVAIVINSDSEALGLGVDQNDFASAHAAIVQQGGAA